MILKNKWFDNIKSKKPEDLNNRLINKKNRVIEEGKKIRVNMIKKLCTINSKEDIEEILKGITPLLRNKKRPIILMGGNYEEVNVETKTEIVTYMTTLPKEEEKRVQSGGASHIAVPKSPSHNFEPIVEELVTIDSPPHITIDSESMQVDSTNVTVDKSEYPFKDLGLANVGNIVDYSSSTNEEKEGEKEGKAIEEEIKNEEVSTKIEIPSTQIIIVTPFTPPTQEIETKIIFYYCES